MSIEPDPHVSRWSLSFHQGKLPKGPSYLFTEVTEFLSLFKSFYAREEFLEGFEAFKILMVFHEKDYKNTNNNKNRNTTGIN